VCLDEVGLLVGLGLLLGLSQLLDQTHRLPLQTAVDPAAGAGVDDIAELIRSEIEETVGRETSRISTFISQVSYLRPLLSRQASPLTLN
jgi:hypothetical protein